MYIYIYVYNTYIYEYMYIQNPAKHLRQSSSKTGF